MTDRDVAVERAVEVLGKHMGWTLSGDIHDSNRHIECFDCGADLGLWSDAESDAHLKHVAAELADAGLLGIEEEWKARGGKMLLRNPWEVANDV